MGLAPPVEIDHNRWGQPCREFMDTVAARRQMVDQQIRTWEVLDPRVLDALSAVPREAFVPPAYRELAFADTPIPIGFGESMLAPVLQGKILQALAPLPTDRILEIGTGTGYLTACLSLLGGATHSLDIRPQFTAAAAANLRHSGHDRNIELETGDAFQRGSSVSEFDVIAVTGSLPVYDTRFQRSLRVGGRLFVVVGVAPVMDATLVRRVDASEWIQESLFETVIDPLLGAAAPLGFVF